MPNIYFKVSRIVQSCLTHCDIYSDLSRNPCERRRTTRQHNVYVQLELNTSYIIVDVKKNLFIHVLVFCFPLISFLLRITFLNTLLVAAEKESSTWGDIQTYRGSRRCIPTFSLLPEV